jgi:hypothetical protein
VIDTKRGVFPEAFLVVVVALVMIALLIVGLKPEFRGYLAQSFDFTNPLLLLFGFLGVCALAVGWFKLRGKEH